MNGHAIRCGGRTISSETTHTAHKLDARTLLRIRLIGLAALVLCLSALAYIVSAQETPRLRNVVADGFQRLMPRPAPANPKSLVVKIDQASLEALGPWPWPRSVLAEVTNRLFELKAAAVGFDIVFAEPDRYGGANLQKIYTGISEETREHLKGLPDPDVAFQNAIRGSERRVVLGRAGVFDLVEGSERLAAELPIEARFEGPVPDSITSYATALANTVNIDELAMGHGLINAQPDADGILRSVPLVAMVGGKPTPSLALELIRIGIVSYDEVIRYDAFKAPIKMEVADGVLRAVSIGEHRVPVQPDGTMRVHFTGGNETAGISALDILTKPDAELAEVSGKLVIVGLSAVGIETLITSPTATRIRGTDIHSQVVEAILNEGWLIRPSWGQISEWGLAIVLGLAAVLFLPLVRPGLAVVLGLCSVAMIVGMSIIAFSQGKLVLDILVPLVGAGVPATVTMAAMFLATESRGRELREIVRIESARAAEARRIQLAMLPAPDDLKDLHESFDVWPLLEPAQSIGGDFYDAFMLGSRHFYFAVGDVTGKGVSAALFMAVAKSLSKAVILRQGRELEAAIGVLHREIARDNPDEMFVTTLLGVMNLMTGTVMLCNAGHENPVILRSNGDVEEFEMEGGPPFCTVEGYKYPVETIELQPGDTLFALTDGVSEARNAKGELFGRKQVLEVFRNVDPGQEPQALVQHLTDTVRTFEAGHTPADDLTVIGVRFNKPVE